jgi:hypothetical protein
VGRFASKTLAWSRYGDEGGGDVRRYDSDVVGRAAEVGAVQPVCAWRKPVGPRASRIGAKGAVQGPGVTYVPRCVHTTMYSGDRRGAPGDVKLACVLARKQLGLAQFDQVYLQNFELNYTNMIILEL